MIHLRASCPSSSVDGSSISCIARKKSGSSLYGTAKAREESRKKEEKRLGVCGTWMAETFSGMIMSSMTGVLDEVESEKTKVVRAKCCATYATCQRIQTNIRTSTYLAGI